MRVATALAALAFAASCSAQPSSGQISGLITRVSTKSVSVKSGSRTETFVNGAGDVPVDHLRVHQKDRLPVRVRWERRDGRRVAVRIDDA